MMAGSRDMVDQAAGYSKSVNISRRQMPCLLAEPSLRSRSYIKQAMPFSASAYINGTSCHPEMT
jgi:hypothetical protein